MPELRTARPDELAEMLAFDREYAGSAASLQEFREWFEARPELFVACVEDGELVAEANGRMERPEEDPTASSEPGIVLQSIAVDPDRRGQGLGGEVLKFFEEQAAKYAETVSVASASNVEDFYQSWGYEPKMILLQIAEGDLPETYDEATELLGERRTDSGDRFLYAGFEEYDPELRRELAEEFDAFEANTIYEKELS